MYEPFECRLDDNSRLTIERTLLNGTWSVMLWRPGSTRQEHGWLLAASSLLDEKALAQLKSVLQEPGEQEAA